jgi:hypothetical protein
MTGSWVVPLAASLGTLDPVQGRERNPTLRGNSHQGAVPGLCARGGEQGIEARNAVNGFNEPLVIEDRPAPEPGLGQVRVTIETSGLCRIPERHWHKAMQAAPRKDDNDTNQATNGRRQDVRVTVRPLTCTKTFPSWRCHGRNIKRLGLPAAPTCVT